VIAFTPSARCDEYKEAIWHTYRGFTYRGFTSDYQANGHVDFYVEGTEIVRNGRTV